MASTKSHSLGPTLSSGEQVAGFCYLPFYVFLLSWGIQYLSDLLGLHLSVLQINLCYFVLNFVIIWIIFHGFLVRSFHGARFWETVQAIILGFCLYYAGNFVFTFVTDLLNITVVNFNNELIATLTGQNFWIMLLGTVFLAPIVEECLVRGLIFGSIHGSSRWAAYLVSIVFFAVIHVWQYLLQYSFPEVLLMSVQYIPAGIALGWTYEKSNTIWAPITLHMLINAISMGVMQYLM